MVSIYLSVPLILFAVNNAKAIDYANYRLNDTVSIDVTRGTARTTREILEKLNNVQITSPESLQDGTEHLLQFAALLRTKILDTFGLLIYDYYDDFDMSEMYSLYRIYQDTLERKYNIFDIVPNVLLNQDLKPTAICNYINYHVQTCLRQVSYTCTKSKFPDIEQDQDNLTSSIELTKSIYDSARLEEKYQNGISLRIILDYLKTNRLQFTPELFSGLLHNVHYDDFDEGVRTAERELIHFFLTNGRHLFKKYLLKPQTIKQYSSVTKLLKGFLSSYQFPVELKRHAEYLSEHIVREPSAVSENIELLGAAYENDSINLRYLFELVLPDDAHDSDIVEARNYLVDQISKQNVVENYLRVEKYQQALPNQMLIGILGQLRDIDFITDIATSLELHARYWHSSHMIENLNQLMELFDAYENLRGIPEHKKLMSTIDKLRKKLTNSNNATIEMSCTRPRNCLRIGLNVIVQCNGINKETKKLINRFLNKSNFGCLNQKLNDKSVDDHETVSKKPIVTTTRKNLEQLSKNKKPASDSITETPALPTKSQTNPNCDDEPCEEDDVLATGDAKLHDANVTVELNISAQAVERETPERINLSTIPPDVDTPTELQADDSLVETVSSPIEVPTAECNNLTCLKNESEPSEIISTTASTTTPESDKIVTDTPTRSTKSNVVTSTVDATSTRSPTTLEIFATTPEPIVTTPKPTCQHRDLHYRQKLRRLEKIDKSSTKAHRDDFENLKANDVNENTISVSATNSVVESKPSDGGGLAEAKDLTKFEIKYGSGSNNQYGSDQSVEKFLEALGEHPKTSGHIATLSVESGSAHSLGGVQKNQNDDKNALELLKKLQALGDASVSHESDSSQDNHSLWHSGSTSSKGKHGGHNKSKKKSQASDDHSSSGEKDSKHGAHHSSSHLGTSHLEKLLESKEALALKKKLLSGNNLSSEEDSSEHGKQKSRNKELSLLSQLKKHKSGSHHTHVLEAAESQRELSGHQETSDSTTGDGITGLHHSRRNLGKTEEASTTEHRRKITQQYRESSRRNSKTSSRSNTTKSKSLGTSEEPTSAFRRSGKRPYGALAKSNIFPPSDEIDLPTKKNDSHAKSRLLDWNTPLLSNYDVAMNNKDPEKVYYRPKRELKNDNKNLNKNANINANDNGNEIENRLFDINLPFFSNYDVALNDKLPFHRRSRATRDTEPVKARAAKHETSVKKDLNSTESIKQRLFDFNLPMGSNQKWRFNAPESSEPGQKQHNRSRRDTAKKNETQVDSKTTTDPKVTTVDPNGEKSSLNNTATDLKPRFLDIQASFGLDGLHASTDLDKNKSNSTGKNSTEDARGRFDISLPSLLHEKPKSRKRREAQHFYEGDNEIPSVSETRRNVDTLFSAVENKPIDDGIDQRLFDVNLPMGSNQKWRFNSPEESEKKNYRSRRFADVTIMTSATTTPTISSLNIDKNPSHNHTIVNNSTIISNTTPAIELRMGNDNLTITDSNTTEKINTTTVAKQ